MRLEREEHRDDIRRGGEDLKNRKSEKAMIRIIAFFTIIFDFFRVESQLLLRSRNWTGKILQVAGAFGSLIFLNRISEAVKPISYKG